MLAYMYKHMLKNNNATAITCLKSTHLCFLNSTHRYLSHNVQSQVTVTRNDDEPVKGLFKNYGFSDTQFSELIKKYPSFLSLNIRMAKPKLDYLHSYGFTSNDLCQIFKADRVILARSLENRIKPSCEFLKSVLKDNASVIIASKRNFKVLRKDISKTVKPNADLLLNHGVPENRIWVLFKDKPGSLMQATEKLKVIIEEVKELGFDPAKRSFLDAIHLFTALNKSTRERKWDLYRKWGWSDDEILSAVRKQPLIMKVSEEKIEGVMDFLISKMGWDVSQISSYPHAIMHSLENWTMPRCLVVQFLLSKGVLKKNLPLRSVVGLNGERFKKRFVDKFCVSFPEVINLCFLNSTQRCLSHNVQSQVTVTRNDDEPVKGLFKNYGFSDTQISELIKKYPSVLSLNISIAKPKLDYLHSYGFTSNDLCQIFKADRGILGRSLENCIKPSCEFLKSVLKDNASVIIAIKRDSRVLTKDISKTVRSNADLLLNHGVPENRIQVMFKDRPGSLIQATEKLKVIIEEVKELGLDPEKRSFLDAIHLFTALNKSTREQKWDLYRKWGWSDDEILSAVRKQPLIMRFSEEKIEGVMDFFINKMGWDVSQISSFPHAIMHSLENWIMPRCLVVQFLLSKGVLKKNLPLSSVVGLNGERFKKRFVDKFCVNFPEVINLYGSAEENAKKFSRKVTN